MKQVFKPHIVNLERYQTSLGRDLRTGLRLDRNERVVNFSENTLSNVLSSLPPNCLTASPDSGSLYRQISGSLEIDCRQIFITSGITEGIRILYDLGCNSGDSVVCIDPTYPMYEVYAKLYNIEFLKVSFSPKTLSISTESLCQKIDNKTRFVFVPNPNLPIESCFSIEELKDIAEFCRSRDVFLVIDEAYHFFGGPSSIEMIEKYKNVIIFRTFSKAYGLAGLRIGFMVSAKENISYFSKSRSLIESNTFSMAVAEYMLRQPDIMRDHVESVREGAEYFQSRLTKMGLKYKGGNLTNGLLVFVEQPYTPDALIRHLKEKNIYIRGNFNRPIQNAVRISLGPVEIMKSAADELEKFLVEN